MRSFVAGFVALVIGIMPMIWMLALDSDASAAVPVSTVGCDKTIGGVGSGRQGGYRVVLQSVSVPPQRLRQKPVEIPAAYKPWTHWVKAGLVVQSRHVPIEVSVPKSWRGRAAITWGNTGIVSSLRIEPCPSGWHAYAGGFYIRTPSACVPLTIRSGRRATTVRFGLGQQCN